MEHKLSWEWYLGVFLGTLCGAFSGWLGVIGVSIGLLLSYVISQAIEENRKNKEAQR